MLNGIFVFLIVVSVLVGAFTGQMSALTQATISSAKSAVDLAIGLIGQMALWLGFMAVLREAGVMRSLARGMEPIMRRLFPEVPADHPAMGAMIMNLSANVLGLGNAATPFGLKAMQELDRLNKQKGVATNAMALFLAINTAGIAVLPLGAIAVRATLGSKDPAGIMVPSIVGSIFSTIAAVLVARATQNWKIFKVPEHVEPGPSTEPTPTAGPSAEALAKAEAIAVERPAASTTRRVIVALIFVALAFALYRFIHEAPADKSRLDVLRGVLSDWLLPFLMLVITSVGFSRKVKVYEVFIAGAKEGFQIAVMVIPFLVAILVAIGLFRASGAMDTVVHAVGPLTAAVGFPAEALPMALIKPLSGSGALAVMTDAMKTYGPDSFVGYLVCVINGSSETTFYVLAVYFGSVAVKETRHTVMSCLSADLAGIIAGTAALKLFLSL